MPKDTFVDLSSTLKKYVRLLNIRQLNSINKNGLASLKVILDLDPSAKVNFITGTQSIQANICLNHLELSGVSRSEVQRALDIAVYEEYTGVMGISWERGYQMVKTSPELSKMEISERLNSNVLFVLKPPTNGYPYDFPVHGGNGTRRVRSFFRADDGLSQARDKLLTSGESVISDRITEIKTETRFSADDVLYVLVPEALLDCAEASLDKYRGKIIPVPSTTISAVKAPQILKELIGEAMDGRLGVEVPDYRRVLQESILGAGLENFCLHAVRLTTTFDTEPRFVADLELSSRLLQDAGAYVCHRNEDGSGWAFVHKTRLIDFAKYNEGMIRRGLTFRFGTAEDIERRIQILAAKGDFAMSRTVGADTDYHRAGFECIGVRAVDCGSYRLISVPRAVVASCSNVLNESKKIGKERSLAALKIQKVYRGSTARSMLAREAISQSRYNAAVDIQRIGKGYLSRKYYQEFRRNESLRRESESRIERLREELQDALVEHDKVVAISKSIRQKLRV